MPVKRKNKEILDLEKIQKIKGKIKRDEAKTVDKIRNGLKDTVVIFIDMVDSTKFKSQRPKRPEVWINKVYQFSKIVKAYLEIYSGTPIKYIGDEVMAVFKGENKVLNAINFINAIHTIEEDISTITGSKTKIKVALDFGKVYNLEYEGHLEPDPQGTPVDRCAKIAKHCAPGTILTSSEFVAKCKLKQGWSSLGFAELKGLGQIEIFQYGEKTINLNNTLSSKQSEEGVNYFRLINKACGKALDVPRSSEKEGIAAIVYKYTGHDNQIFKISSSIDGCNIVAKHSNICLSASSAENATPIQQVNHKLPNHKLWYLIPNKDGSFFILTKLNQRVLEVDAQQLTKEDGGRVILHDFNGHDHQKWILQPVIR